MGPNSAPISIAPAVAEAPLRNAASDSVGATVAQFRVNESGNATYSIPIQVTPGVAGMVPKLALTYNSQIPHGVMGPGWIIEGTSQIGRCRQTRENGDFMDGLTPVDGNPSPVNFTGSDRLCLDGVRLLVTSGAYWDGNAVYAPENDPFTRVAVNGFSFTVKRKDGTTSSYGDTVVSPNSRPTVSIGFSAVAVNWNLSRVQDSVGNYINYLYTSQPGVATHAFTAGAVETVLSTVEYTGHATSPVRSTYASVKFEYDTLPAARLRLGYQAGAAFVQTQQLARIKVEDATHVGTPSNPMVRFYTLTYGTSASGSDAQQLRSLKECRDSSELVCFPPTQFSWSAAINHFAVDTAQTASSPTFVGLVGYKLADIDGDGRQDVIWARNSDSCGSNTRIYVSFLDRTATNQMTLATPTQAVRCAPRNLLNDDQSWHLIDYDADGRSDLLIAGAEGGSWQLYLGAGRPSSGGAVFGATNQLASLSPAIPVLTGQTRHPGVLTDLNGDGLPDFMYPVTPGVATGNSSINARLLQRQSTGVYSFSAPYAVDINFLPTDACRAFNTECSLNFFRDQGGLSTSSGDVNGDGRGDLTFIVLQECFTNPCPEGTGQPGIPVFDAELGIDGPPRGTIPDSRMAWYQFTSDGTQPPNTGSTIPRLKLTQYWTQNTTFSNGELPYDPALLYLADLNGDGLMDIVYQDKTTVTTYWAMINKGVPSNPAAFPVTVAYQPAISVSGISNGKHLQFADVTGDGRVDWLYPTAISATYSKRTLLSNGTFTGATAVAGGGMTAGSNLDQWINLVGEFDGDGSADFLRLNVASGSNNLYASRAASSSRYRPRDVVTMVTNGHGALTKIDYQPLTNKGIYQRGEESGVLARTLNYGWNSPVFDVLAPMYVVNKVESSAPVRGSPGALSVVRYRYQGAQMQAGGRGFLGFNVIWIFDNNHALSPNRYVVTRNSYAQNYPFIGAPTGTHTLAVSGSLSMGSAELDACAANPEAGGYACFAPAGAAPWPDLVDDGILVAWGGNQPLCNGPGCATDNNNRCNLYTSGQQEPLSLTIGLFTPQATASPLHTYVYHDVSAQYDLASGSEGLANAVKTTETRNGYCYEDGYGNLTRSRTVTWGGSGTHLAQKLTANTYTNNTALWHLGRLTLSTVQFLRPSQPTITRSTTYTYSATTGLLTSERIQPGGDTAQDLRTVYTHDDFGNRTGAYQCSADRVTELQCRTIDATFRQQPNDGAGHSGTRVHRYAKTTYDANGRYSTGSRLPFYTAAGTTHLNEQTALTIVSRDEFGNPTQQSSANGLVQTTLFGSLGRPYYAADNTGHASTTTYSQCTTVSCPSDATFRSQTMTAGTPTSWNYFDLLGRPVLAITQSFDANVANQKFSAVCSYYDAHGRTTWQSEPFFAPATVGGDDSPSFTMTMPCNSVFASTAATYDVLGRVVSLANPDGGTVLKEYVGLTTFTTNPRSFTSEETKNALGEVVETRDPEVSGDSSVGLIVTQTYDATGNVLAISRNAGHGVISTSMLYDALGRKRTMIDPDANTIQYTYNAAGDVISQTDHKGQTTIYDFDAMGRNWQRVASGADGNTLTDIWLFDTAANGLGHVESESRQATTGLTFSRSTTFDTYGRLFQRHTSIAGNAYTETTTYNGYGRVDSHQDASGETLTNVYSTSGYLGSLVDSRYGTIYQVLSMTARGQIAEDKRGNHNGLKSSLTYDPMSGRVNTICSGTSSCNLQDLRYSFDLAGNLKERERSRTLQPTTEELTYDALNRVTLGRLSKIDGVPQIGFRLTALAEYDKLGNICSKDGIDYHYSGRAGCDHWGAVGSPHAVTMIGTQGRSYDASGNLEEISGDRSFAYNAHNQLVGAFNSKGLTASFEYAPSGDRFYQLESTGRSVFYIGNVEFVTISGVVQEMRRSLRGVAIDWIRPKGAGREIRYTYSDHLGSMDVIASASGVLLEASSFDYHGNRRSTDTWMSPGLGAELATTPRGFTDHEHVKGLGFIHMNGRTYDPVAGRMMQADPIMDGSPQGLNRYSYVANNPLSLTDPTGYSAWGGIIRAVVAIVVVIYAPYLAPYLGNSMVAAYAVAGFASGVIATGTLKGGIYGAFSAMLFYGIGQQFANAGTWATEGANVFGTNLNIMGYSAKVVAHGMAGGVMSSLQGGKFGNGFVSAGTAQAFSGAIDRLDPQNPVGVRMSASRIVAAAAVGGTTSVIAGDKFANGAITGAFSRAFNDESIKRLTKDQRLSLMETAQAYRKEVMGMTSKELYEAYPGILSAYDPNSLTNSADMFKAHVDYQMRELIAGNMTPYLAQSFVDGLDGVMSDAMLGYGLSKVGKYVGMGWVVYGRGESLWESLGFRLPETRVSCSPSSNSCVFFTGD